MHSLQIALGKPARDVHKVITGPTRGGEASAGVERGLEPGAVALGGEPLASGVLVLFVGFVGFAASREEDQGGSGADQQCDENESYAYEERQGAGAVSRSG